MSMITFTERIDKALRVAARAHEQQNQHRKGSDIPYIIHPVSVMLIAGEATNDEDILVACLLHDVLEDVSADIYSETRMRDDFGDRVVELVKDVSKNPSLTDWYESARDYLEHLEYHASEEALMVSAADKIHNLISNVIDYKVVGEDLWQRFTTKSAEDQIWWYESVLVVLKKRLPSSALTAKNEATLNELKQLITANSS